MKSKLDITNTPLEDDYIDLEKQVTETTRTVIERDTPRGNVRPSNMTAGYVPPRAAREEKMQPQQQSQPQQQQPQPQQSQIRSAAAHKRKKNKKHGGVIAIMVMILLVLMAATACVLLVQENRRIQNEMADAEKQLAVYANSDATYSQAEMDAYAKDVADAAVEESQTELLTEIKQDVDAYGILTMLRNLYPDDLVIAADGRYNFIPINYSLPMHNLDPDRFLITDNKDYEYYDGEKRISHRGVDVSRFQGNIDWNKVANDNVEFAIVRLGLRGYGTGEIKIDANYEANVSGALEAGLDVGVYFYSQAISEEEAIEEADFVLENLQGYDINMPVVLDVEWVDGDGRANKLTPEERTHIAKVFCERISAAGYEPMIYGNTKTFVMMLDLTQLQGVQQWFAYYNLPLYYPYAFNMFQYSESGRVDGIPEKVDLNIIIGDYQTY